MPTTADRVLETSTTTGTGALALVGAATGKRTFNAAFDVSSTAAIWYAIEGGAEWEVGIGRLTAFDTLTRDTVLASSNANALVSFSVGMKSVFATVPAVALAPPVNPAVVYISPVGNDSTAVVGDARFPFLTINAAITGAGSAKTFMLAPGTYAQGSGYVKLPAGTTWCGASIGTTAITFDGTQTLNPGPNDANCCVQPVQGAGAPVILQDLTLKILAYADTNSALVGASNIELGQVVYPDMYLYRCKLYGYTDVFYGTKATFNVYAFDCYIDCYWDTVYAQNGSNFTLRNCDIYWHPTRDVVGTPPIASTWAQLNGDSKFWFLGGSLTVDTVGNNTSVLGDTWAQWRGLTVSGGTTGRIAIGGGWRRINKNTGDGVIPNFTTLGNTPNIELLDGSQFDVDSFSIFPGSAAPRIHTLGNSRWLSYRIGVTATGRNSRWVTNAAALTQAFPLFQLPPTYVVEGVQVIVSTAAAGPTTVTAKVGTSTTPAKYVAATTVKTAGAMAFVAPNAVENANGNPYTAGTAEEIVCTIDTTGANVSTITGLELLVMVKIGGGFFSP